MRKYVLIILLLCTTYQVKSQYVALGFAQLLIDGILTWQEGGYEYKHTWYGSEQAQIHGLRGGWFLNDKRSSLLGFSMYFSYTDIHRKFLSQRQELGLFYSTLYYEHTIKPQESFNISPYLHLGWGVGYTYGNLIPQDGITTSGFFLAEPGVNLYFKLFKWCKLGSGLGYRNVIGSRLYNAGDNILSGANINFSVKFGNYRND